METGKTRTRRQPCLLDTSSLASRFTELGARGNSQFENRAPLRRLSVRTSDGGDTSGTNSLLGSLHLVDLGDAADFSEVQAASIFSVEVCKVGEFLYILEPV